MLDLVKNLVGFIVKYAVEANLFRLVSSIPKHACSRGAAPMGGGVVGGGGGGKPPTNFFSSNFC